MCSQATASFRRKSNSTSACTTSKTEKPRKPHSLRPRPSESFLPSLDERRSCPQGALRANCPASRRISREGPLILHVGRFECNRPLCVGPGPPVSPRMPPLQPAGHRKAARIRGASRTFPLISVGRRSRYVKRPSRSACIPRNASHAAHLPWPSQTTNPRVSPPREGSCFYIWQPPTSRRHRLYGTSRHLARSARAVPSVIDPQSTEYARVWRRNSLRDSSARRGGFRSPRLQLWK